MKPEVLINVRTDLGEGPVWAPLERAFYFVDILNKKIFRYRPEDGNLRQWSAPCRTAFLLPAESGLFLAGCPDELHLFSPASGAFTPFSVVEPQHGGNRLNDGCVDPDGRVWFGTMDDEEKSARGSIYRLTGLADGKFDLSHQDEGYIVSNGPAVSPEGDLLYVCSSPEQIIYVFNLSGDGVLSGKRIFARLTQGYPDGITTDSEGNLWCGVWGGSRIMVFSPGGKIIREIPMPVSNVTKVAFGGKDRRQALVTTARKGLTAEQLGKEPLAGAVFSFVSDVPGAPQPLFRGF